MYTHSTSLSQTAYFSHAATPSPEGLLWRTWQTWIIVDVRTITLSDNNKSSWYLLFFTSPDFGHTLNAFWETHSSGEANTPFHAFHPLHYVRQLPTFLRKQGLFPATTTFWSWWWWDLGTSQLSFLGSGSWIEIRNAPQTWCGLPSAISYVSWGRFWKHSFQLLVRAVRWRSKQQSEVVLRATLSISRKKKFPTT